MTLPYPLDVFGVVLPGVAMGVFLIGRVGVAHNEDFLVDVVVDWGETVTPTHF